MSVKAFDLVPALDRQKLMSDKAKTEVTNAKYCVHEHFVILTDVRSGICDTDSDNDYVTET